MQTLTVDDLHQAFSDAALRAGRAYSAQGRVTGLRVSPDGRSIADVDALLAPEG